MEPLTADAAARVLELKAQEIPETSIVAGISSFLRMRQIEHTQTYTTRRFVGPVGRTRLARNPQRGLPDIIGTFAWGQMFALEVKRPGGMLRNSQAEWILRQPPTAIILIPESVAEVMEVVDPLLAHWKPRTAPGGWEYDPVRVQAMWGWLLTEDQLWRTRRSQVTDQAAYRLYGKSFRQKLGKS